MSINFHQSYKPPTNSGERLDITPVDGLSFSNRSRRWGASSEDQISSSSCSSAILRKESSWDVFAGYSCFKIRERTLDSLNSAKAEDNFVDSPGNVGRKPFSDTYSSSASTGSSQCVSISVRRVGSPRWAAEKLGHIQYYIGYRISQFIPVKSVNGPKDLLPRFYC